MNKDKITNIYLTDSVLTTMLFKNKTRKDSLWESFARRCILSFKTVASSHRPGLATKELIGTTGYSTMFTFYVTHQEEGASTSHHREDLVLVLTLLRTYPETLQTQIAWRPAFTLTHTSHPFPALPVPV